tara:strand:+ start:5285 stop:5644 length:360 start_codon:yes stop_codon:yes gene_type:complete
MALNSSIDMNKAKNLKPFLFLISAWLIVFVSFYFETIVGSSLFSRSGSLMVLFAVIANHSLLKGRDEYHHNQLQAYSRGTRVNLEEIHPSKKHQYLETFAHINIVLGTVIWGYGDLLFQ